MTNKDALYFLDEIEDTFRKTKSIYRTGKDETAFDRAIEKSENHINTLREYFKNNVVLGDVIVSGCEHVFDEYAFDRTGAECCELCGDHIPKQHEL